MLHAKWRRGDFDLEKGLKCEKNRRPLGAPVLILLVCR